MPKRRFDGRLVLDSADQSPSRQLVASRQLVELLSRALLDSVLRETLFADSEAVARAFGLGPDETQRVKRLDRERFERRVVALRSA
jgi:hypothetical protein